MVGLLHSLGASIAVSAFAGTLLWVAFEPDGPFYRRLARYDLWWQRTAAKCRIRGWTKSMPRYQFVSLALCAGGYISTSSIWFVLVLLLLFGLPPVLLVRCSRAFDRSLEAGLDRFLLGLADSLQTIPNLAGALESLIPNIEEPLKSEASAVLAEVRLGRSIDEALMRLAKRLHLPGLDAAVAAALLGKRTGGDLPSILRKIAATGREMSRLEGVVRTKTAEGRSQAWVMGSVPPFLILALEWVNPNWLAPMWSDPIGWGFLAVAGVAEAVAILLIRKIVAVEI